MCAMASCGTEGGEVFVTQLWGKQARRVTILVDAVEHTKGQREGVAGMYVESCTRTSTTVGTVLCHGVSCFSKGEPVKKEESAVAEKRGEGWKGACSQG